MKVRNAATSPLERGPVRRDHLAAKASGYAGQLAAYRETLEVQGLMVAATWIHVPLAGAVAKIGPC